MPGLRHFFARLQSHAVTFGQRVRRTGGAESPMSRCRARSDPNAGRMGVGLVDCQHHQPCCRELSPTLPGQPLFRFVQSQGWAVRADPSRGQNYLCDYIYTLHPRSQSFSISTFPPSSLTDNHHLPFASAFRICLLHRLHLTSQLASNSHSFHLFVNPSSWVTTTPTRTGALSPYSAR